MKGAATSLEETIDRLIEERSRVAEELASCRAFGLADEAADAEARLRAIGEELRAARAALRAGGTA